MAKPRNPDERLADIPKAVKRAIGHHERGAFREAEQLYLAVLGKQPENFDALHFLGILRAQQGNPDVAVELISRAIEHDPQSADARSNLGNVFLQLGRYSDAIASYEKALEINPALPGALYSRGFALQELNRNGEAVASYDRAVALQPDHAPTLFNRGNALQELGRHEEAIASYDKALAIIPGDAGILNNRGTALLMLGRFDDAIASYDRALALRPDFPDALVNRGNALAEVNRLEEAVACYRRALQIDAGHTLALSGLGVVLAEQGKREEALECYDRILALDPNNAEARWMHAMVTLPIVVGPNEDTSAHRQQFSRELEDLSAWFRSSSADAADLIGQSQPFWLVYQEENNRELLAKYGTLCVNAMTRWQGTQNLPVTGNQPSRPMRDGPAGPLRVGIVSAHFHNHSVWICMVKGWLKQFDRDRIQPHLFYLGLRQDSETAWARSSSASFTQGARGLRQWVDAIREIRPDVLIYPEVGMNAMTTKLASLRLANLQVTSWGNPDTTGLPTLDYYLSAEAFEPPGAQENYTERLVALPRLGCRYTPLSIAPVEPDLARLGIDSSAPIFVCSGSPFKYTPRHDPVFIEIARRIGRCQFIFFTHERRELTEKLVRRLSLSFAQAGLNFPDYCKFLPWQTPSEFHGLMKRSDAYLDTFGFSGFTTAMQAIECGLPIVTMEGRFMRGRLASGILRTLGVDELVAGNESDYAALAERLAMDAKYRQLVRERIERSRDTLYDDVVPVQALQEFLIQTHQ